MNYRLFTSLLLIAVLTCLFLWGSQPDGDGSDAPRAPQNTSEPIGRVRIF